MGVLVVVPALNEVAHVETTVRSLLAGAQDLQVQLVVVDGGSDDGTQAVVQRMADQDPRISLLHNPARVQSAAMNLAVSQAPAELDVVVRADCHSGYPSGWLSRVVESLLSRRAEGCVSVVVPMRSVGTRPLQRALAQGQNSFIGNGGSLHRRPGVQSQYVDHGHHAAFLRCAYVEAGGYDETMVTNEDAELDERLRARGGRIFLDASLLIDYYPRTSLGAVWRQYLAYGRGRFVTWRVHGTALKARQMAPLAVTGMLAGTVLVAPRHPRLMLPAVSYLAGCSAIGAVMAARTKDPALLLMGPTVVTSHVGWGTGFMMQAASRGTGSTGAGNGRSGRTSGDASTVERCVQQIS